MVSVDSRGGSMNDGYIRVRINDVRWAALCYDNDTHAWGGTIWEKSADGNDYALGATAGFPVEGKHNIHNVAALVENIVEGENGYGK
jgi:hypothetical protein